MNRIFLSFVPLLCTGLIYGNILRVPTQYSTIRSAVDASTDGDTILVAPGEYFENITLYGKRIVLASHYLLTGDRSFIVSTIINGSQPVHTDTASVIRIVHSEDSSTVIIGFTITGGAGTIWTDPLNPGYVWRGGGGILILNSSPVICNNIIRHNSVTNTTGVDGAQGGGILTYAGYPEIRDNLILKNNANYGGGLVMDYSGGKVSNNVLYRNAGGIEWYGGTAIWAMGEPTVPHPKIIENNSIISNTATAGTGGILVWNTTVTIRNNILWGNSIIQIKKQGGTAYVTYNNIQGGYTGTGNINVNPMFADSQFLLQSTSLCVDAGDTSMVYYDPQNPSQPGFAEWPSHGTIRNDMGAYGGPKRMLQPAYNDRWITSSPASINFGTVVVTDSVVKKIALTSKGSIPVRVDSVCIKHHTPGIRCLTNFPLSLAPCYSDTILVQWHPASNSPLTDTLMIYHNDTSIVNPISIPISGTVSLIDVPNVKTSPADYSLNQNYPNPFNPVTTIQYYLPKPTWVRLSIYNVLGQPVKELINQFQTAGIKRVQWNGTNDKNLRVSSGIYFYKLKTESIEKTRKMVLSQ